MSIRFIPHQDRLDMLDAWIIELQRQGDRNRRLKLLKFLASETRSRMSDPEPNLEAIETCMTAVMASQNAMGFDNNRLADLGREVMARRGAISDALRLRAKQYRGEQ